MAVIINKSNHPVEVKIIPLQVWSLRDEIEHAISKVIHEDNQEQIDQIKVFYSQEDDEAEKPELDRSVPAKKFYHGQVILADINMDEILFFTDKEFKSGQSLGIKLDIPEGFIISAQVTMCLNTKRRSKVIKANALSYRVSAKFIYSFKDEDTNLRKFLKSIEPVIPTDFNKTKPLQDEESNDEDFEDLGF